MSLEQTKDSISKEFKDFTFGLSKGHNWGFSFLSETKQAHAQFDDQEIQQMVYFIHRNMDLSFIPDFKKLKEIEEDSGKRIDLMNENLELDDHNKSLKESLGYMRARLIMFNEAIEDLAEKAFNGQITQIDDITNLLNQVKYSKKLIQESENDL